MALSPAQERKLLAALLVVLVALAAYRVLKADKPKTAPLAYPPGSVAAAPVRRGISSPTAEKDPLLALIAGKDERYPGVIRDIFRMTNPAPPKPKLPPQPPPSATPPPPPVPTKTPEELAADLARADLSKFKFYGYVVTDDKTSSLFLAKDGELFIAKSGEMLLKNYKIKEAGKDYVVLLDTITHVEVRVELTGGAEPAPPGPPRMR